MTPIVPSPKLLAQPDQSLLDRRNLLEAQGFDLGYMAPGQLGLAFSGGGIRSATISLGVAQALAGAERLLDFDYMSTVSGGGYFGGFLRSLFLPQAARGSKAEPVQPAATQQDTDFALNVLKLDPFATTITDRGVTLTNPIRWLRENSRYLAPAGPTDYAVGATFILRNWLAMLFVFALPMMLFFLLLHFGLHTLGDRLDDRDIRAGGFWAPVSSAYRVSILFAVPGALLVVSIVFGVANWLTVFTADLWAPPAGASRAPNPALRVLATATVAFLAGLALLLLICQSWDGDQLHWPTGQWDWQQGFPPLGHSVTPTALMVGGAVLLAIGAIAAALVAMAGVIWLEVDEPKIGTALFGNELRRWLTDRNSLINIALGVTLLLAVIDTIALWLMGSNIAYGRDLAVSTLAAAAGRALIQKLGASFGKASPGGGFTKFVAHYIWQVAFVAAVLLWSGFAMLLDVLVRKVAYQPGDWMQAGALGLAILAVAIVMIRAAAGFINLSSLHSLYAARLTRAYLGASNRERLQDADLQDVTGYQAKDIIKADIYQQTVCAAPLHLMNITLNETISATGSQMLERDRKGVPLVIAPEGIWIDAAAAAPTRTVKINEATCSWADFSTKNAEAFSVGQITAISGAAVSSAMGARTTLGGALLFTYANIRLGYWWKCGKIENNPTGATPFDWLGWTGTFGYLLREMTARYRSTTARVNLSDGGHFEDSGVYELLRRDVRTIVYCDNGEDIGYHFADLQILVRKARLDIGVSVEVATPAEVLATLGADGAEIFLNGRDGDWRARARARNHEDSAFALLLLVRDTDGVEIGSIVLLKPSLFGSLPADVWGYAEAHPSFPQETTADQFFTEAQWESYRKLGFMMMQQLLDISPKNELFRRL